MKLKKIIYALFFMVTFPAVAADKGTLTIPTTAVTGNPLGVGSDQMVIPISILNGRELSLKRENTLAETLNSIPGVSNSSFGPSVGRPMIRGMDSDRVKIRQNGVNNLDASNLSFELEDGTKVTLNANSSLTFPAVFDTNQRNVTLKGEAFFEVAKDKKRPFRVITGDIVTTVLGTKFNVNTNLLNKGVQIALVEGKVAVNYAQKNRTSVVLNPNEVLTFDQENNSLSKNNVDVNEFTGWKDGALKFKNASFNDVSNKLFHYYGIQLINKSNDTNWSYTGEFVNRDYLSIVKSICYAKKMKFNRFDNTIIIYK